jgi:hypothetical protein
VRIANWRFLATSDAKGPANFKTAVDDAGAAIAALEKATGAGRLAPAIAPIKAAIKDYAASFSPGSACCSAWRSPMSSAAASSARSR